MFKAGASLRNSAANLSAYLTKIRPGIDHLSPQLQAALGGAPPLQVLDQLRAKLDAASTAAALARNRIPELTQAINETKGSILLNLRDLLQFARVAFDAEGQRMGKFNLDLIRARAPRDASTVTVSTPTSPTTPTAPTSTTPALPASTGGTAGAP